MNNPELQRAWQIIENTGTHLFLTGKAGTGKTTFLRNLKKESPKRTVIVAPTGIAAINAGGVTIHSFFRPDQLITLQFLIQFSQSLATVSFYLELGYHPLQGGSDQ